MLWYKAWLETRARFLIALLGILCLCSYSVLHGELQAEPWVDLSYYNYVLSDGYGLLAVMWVLAVTLLMMAVCPRAVPWISVVHARTAG